MTTSAEIRRGPSAMRFEPATGRAKERLEADCIILLRKTELTPLDFEYFVHSMIALMERTQEGPAIRTPYLVDEESRHAIYLQKYHRTKEANVYICPKWEALPEREREAVRSETTESFLSEVVATKRPEGENKVVIAINRMIVYPPSYNKDEHVSYATGEKIRPDIKVRPLGESVFTGEQSRTLASRIFRLWKQTDTNKAPQV
ncbi:MAG: hypothetical protein Q7R31_03615 [Candidatus Levybacteria bacterium]|nr:hypothetical protein [Candidatus Levybacteria bacterium]